MPSKAKAKPCQWRQVALRRPAAQQGQVELRRPAAQRAQNIRRRPAVARRRVKVKSHLRSKRPRGLKYKTQSQRSLSIGVCNKCGEVCIHCRAKGIVAIKPEVKRDRDDPPTGEDSRDADSDALTSDLGRLIEEDGLR